MYKCKYCGKEFKNKRGLATHLLNKQECREKKEQEAKNPELVMQEPPITQAPVNESPEPVREPKGTNSWEKDSFNDEFFSQPNILHIKLKDPSLKARWVTFSGDRPKVQKWLGYGYRYAKKEDIANINHLPLQYGSNTDTRIIHRELVLMVVSKERAQKLRDWKRSKNYVDPNSYNEAFRDQVKRTGGKVLEESDARDMPVFDLNKNTNAPR